MNKLSILEREREAHQNFPPKPQFNKERPPKNNSFIGSNVSQQNVPNTLALTNMVGQEGNSCWKTCNEFHMQEKRPYNQVEEEETSGHLNIAIIMLLLKSCLENPNSFNNNMKKTMKNLLMIVMSQSWLFRREEDLKGYNILGETMTKTKQVLVTIVPFKRVLVHPHLLRTSQNPMQIILICLWIANSTNC